MRDISWPATALGGQWDEEKAVRGTAGGGAVVRASCVGGIRRRPDRAVSCACAAALLHLNLSSIQCNPRDCQERKTARAKAGPYSNHPSCAPLPFLRAFRSSRSPPCLEAVRLLPTARPRTSSPQSTWATGHGPGPMPLPTPARCPAATRLSST